MRNRSGAALSLLLVLPLLAGCRPGTSWSPDGKQIALDPAGQLFTFDVGAKKFRQRPTGPLKVMNPNWSADGRKLLYYLAALKGEDVTALSLAQMDFATGKQTPLAAKLTITKPANKPEDLRINLGNTQDIVRILASASWSPDSTRLVYGAPQGEDAGIFVAKADGTGSRPILPQGRQGIDATWSPDSGAIAFFGSPPAEAPKLPEEGAPPMGPRSPDLDVISADGTGHRVLWESKTRGKLAPFGPAPRWSSDGKSIFVLVDGEAKPGVDRPDNCVLWSVPVDGGEPKMVAPVPGPGPFVTLTPNATALTFFFAPKSDTETAPTLAWATAPFSELKSLHLLDTKATGLPEGGDVERFPIPDISPDGRSIAIAIMPKKGKSSLVLASADGGPIERFVIPVAAPAAATTAKKPVAKKPAPRRSAMKKAKR